MEEIRGAKKAKDKVAQVRQSGAVGRIQDDFLVFGPTSELSAKSGFPHSSTQLHRVNQMCPVALVDRYYQ
jgi:hypothetical protein